MAPLQGTRSREECGNELTFLPVELRSACAQMGESWKSIYLKKNFWNAVCPVCILFSIKKGILAY